jgi:hypothetical protein
MRFVITGDDTPTSSVSLPTASYPATTLLGLDARIAMALHAVLEVPDAFPEVFRAHIGLRMLMAPVAGIPTVVVVLMAGVATGFMVACGFGCVFRQVED